MSKSRRLAIWYAASIERSSPEMSLYFRAVNGHERFDSEVMQCMRLTATRITQFLPRDDPITVVTIVPYEVETFPC